MIGIIGMTVGIILEFPLHSAIKRPECLNCGCCKNGTCDSTTIEAGCENCGCCKDGVCGSGFAEGRQIMSDFCKHGCIPGYGGNKCYSKCPSYCLTCNQTKPQICESCADGKYLITTDRRECLNCSFKCKKCTSLTKCQECISPYFNDEITTDCSLTCPRNCLCESVGTCSSCAHGYYNITNQCRDVCPSTCSHCTDKSHCLSCQPTYSGDMCCVKDGYCKRCSSSTVCDKCVYGYYGQTCNKPCPGACQKTTQETQCEKENGTCLSCGVGLYGDYCTLNCSERCLNSQCHKDTGNCTDGCVAGFDGPTCAEKKCLYNEADTVKDNGKVIGIVTTVFVAILLIIIILSSITLRKWKEKYQRMNRESENNVSYVNTQSQPTSMDKDDVCSYENAQFEYETLDERNVTHIDEYEQL